MTLPGLVAANNLSDVVDRERAWDNLGSSVSTNIPIPSPSLDLNFASNKSLVDDISGNNLITFSRASTGTFVGSNGLIQTAASGVPRFDHNPTTGESLGLLVEEARTNLVTYSQAFNNTNYSIGYDGGGFTENATVAPDGTLTASKLTRNAGTSGTFWSKYNRQYIPVTNGTVYTLSCFLKAAEITTVRLHGDVRDGGGLNFSAAFTLTGSGSYALSSGTSAQISSAGNGWYRCSVTGTSTSTEDEEPALIVFGTGASEDGFFAWGFQLEAGAFPTSYIPTVASTVTRAADVASMTGGNFSSWYNQSAGSFFVNANHKGSSHFNNAIFLKVNNGTTNNQIKIFSVGADPYLYITYIAAEQAYIDAGSVSVGLPNKYAAGFTVNSFALSVNGATAVTDTSGTSPMDMTQLNIGARLSGVGQPNGTIARLAFYPARIADLALSYITSASGSPSSTTYPYTFTIKGKDTLALNSVSNASTRDFVFIKGLLSAAQPRLTTAAQQVASGTVFQDAAMLKASPTTSGNYLFSSGVSLSGVSTRINGTPALSIATSPFSGSTATASILLRELQPQTNWRITEPMPSGTIASPEFAIPFETNDFVLFMKAGQN